MVSTTTTTQPVETSTAWPTPDTPQAGGAELADARKHLEKRAAEIETQTARYGEGWWPEGVAHAAAIRTVLTAAPAPDAKREAALREVKAAKAGLHQANEDGLIGDTLWCPDGITTVFDAIDTALAALENTDG